MLSYEEALAIAKSKKEKINGCTEFNNAYSFYYNSGERTVGGDSPIVIMKETGEALNFISYAITPNKKIIREFDVEQ